MEKKLQQSVASELVLIVEEAYQKLRVLSDSGVSVKPAPDKWSSKQLIGHLVDSAANNHQRFIRAQEFSDFAFPKYSQDHWVDSQGYDESPWAELLEFWRIYNRHLARVIKRIPDETLQVPCRIGEYNVVKLGFLLEDYLVHLKHHLKQIDSRQNHT
ncbi:MAG: DinB family protein [Acidobacteriota bacterium]|nr:DinB family protein [Acidobacteriota bacterium]